MKFLRTTLIVGLFTAASAPCRADMGFPGMKNPHVTLSIRTSEEIPDFVFLVVREKSDWDQAKRETVTKNEGAFITLTVDQPIEVSGHRRENVELWIIAKTTAASFPSTSELLNANPPVVPKERIRLDFDESVPEWYGNDFTVNYRLVRASDDRFELVRVSWRPVNQCCVVAILIPIGFICGGFWLIRRLWRNWRKEPPRLPNPFSDEK